MRIINVPDLSPPDDAFTHLELRQNVEWIRLSGLPQNAIERQIKILRVSRYRAAAQAALCSRESDVVISHLPLMSTAISTLLRVKSNPPRHIAFAFNFTDRPTGQRLKFMKKALLSIDRFVVFSDYERQLYSNLFGIEISRFESVVWTQNPPKIDTRCDLSDFEAPFFCAIGGEGGDLKIILDAAKILKNDARFVIITRPIDIDINLIPKNVQFLFNIPLGQVWALAAKSLGVLVQLKSLDTCCGHITLVGAKQLGLPVVTTSSYATKEYVHGRESALLSDPGDTDAFVRNLILLNENHKALKDIAIQSSASEISYHDRIIWGRLLDSIVF